MKTKRWIAWMVALVLVVAMFPVSVLTRAVAYAPTDTVNIPDPNFLALLNQELDETRPSDTPITYDEMASLTSINTRRAPSAQPVSSIEGISAAVNLKQLTVSGDVDGLDEIAQLDTLTSLDVSSNDGVKDLSFVGNKPLLVTLTVSQCPQLTTLDGLSAANCPNLSTLDLSSNSSLVDLSALSNTAFDNLKKLDLGDSAAITDITPLSGYLSLTYLNLEKVSVTAETRADYQATVSSLTSLGTLYMPYCNITDGDAQAMFPPLSQLEVLVLNVNELSNVDFLEDMSADLTTLGLYGNDISDLSPVVRFPNLEILGFSGNYVTDFSFVSQLPKLTDGSVRHSEGSTSFPFTSRYLVGQPDAPVNIVDGTLSIPNPYVQPDGTPVSFADAAVADVIQSSGDQEYTISYDEASNNIILENLTGNASFYVDYQLPVSNGEFKVCELFIYVYAQHQHQWGAPTYTWADDGSSCTATRVCEYDADHVETATAVITQEQTKAPTCTQAGETTYTATFDQDWALTQTKTLTNVAPTGHAWAQPTYTWAEDGSTCTATRVCDNDAGHVETATAVITQEQTKAPTCTQAGETTYTATFDQDWALPQTKTLADVAKLPHSYSQEWQWNDTEHFHGCTVCGEKTDAAPHSFQWITDTQAGEKYQKCSVCGYQLAAEPLPTSTPAPSATPNPVPSATPDPSQPPQTGDTSSVLLWISALAMCSILLPALMAWKRNAK